MIWGCCFTRRETIFESEGVGVSLGVYRCLPKSCSLVRKAARFPLRLCNLCNHQPFNFNVQIQRGSIKGYRSVSSSESCCVEAIEHRNSLVKLPVEVTANPDFEEGSRAPPQLFNPLHKTSLCSSEASFISNLC